MATFKERVKNTVISCAKVYKTNFIETEYFIYSKHFTQQSFYTIAAKEDNYLHLTGLITELSPFDFFQKCFNGSLTENDFELGDKSNIGSIRRKMQVLFNACNLFNNSNILIEERFIKKKISCAFASSDTNCTIGFCLPKNSKPLTLLKGNMLVNTTHINLVMKKSHLESNFDLIIFNDLAKFELDNVINTLIK